jgi:hypothetical protein
LKDKELKTMRKEIEDLKSLNISKLTQRDICFDNAFLRKDNEILLMDEKLYDLRMELEELRKTIEQVAVAVAVAK